MQLTKLSNEVLVENLEELVRRERRTTVEILEYLKEVDSRRLYLQLGHTSLFSYLTRGLGYTPASAQRRIESARLMKSVPQIAESVADGSLNLMQLSMVAQGFKQQTVGHGEKLQLLEKLKQRDESLRLEITLSKEQQTLLKRAKDLLSHVHHNPSWVELLELMAKDVIRLRDPSRPMKDKRPSVEAKGASHNKLLAGSSASRNSVSSAGECRTTATKMVAPQRQAESAPTRRKPIPAAVKRLVFNRDQCCQWRDPLTHKICGSTFQLQLDHQNPVRNGGLNQTENLQLLCSVHNRHKFRIEENLVARQLL